MSLILNRAKAATATTGTGTVTIGSAVVPFQSWANAGAVDGYSYSYLIEDGNDWEIGIGVYSSTGPTLTRALIASSTGVLLNLSGTATVACVANAGDLQWRLGGFWDHSVSGSAASVDFTDLGMIQECLIIGRGITTSSSAFRSVWASTDNGATFPATSGDYVTISATGVDTATTSAGGHSTSTTAARTSIVRGVGLSQNGMPKVFNSNGFADRIFLGSLAPVNAFRFGATAGNMTAGQIFCLVK